MKATTALAFVVVLGLQAGAVAAEGEGPPEGTQTDSPAATEAEGFESFEEFGESTPTAKSFDPLEPYNRVVFAFNDRFYLWVWDPVARGYAWVVPEPAREALNRAFYNFATPVRFGNNLLQLKFKRAGTELGRLLVNSTVGLAGLFDPAESWFDWRPPPREDFGQTLGRYGVGAGIPLVLPFLGTMNLRDGVGLVPDIAMTPIVYYTSTEESVGLRAGEIFNRSSLHLDEYQSLKKDALDPYTFFRETYRQNRLKEITE